MHRGMVPASNVCSQMQDICHLLYGDNWGMDARACHQGA
jgi:hypothetical protein